MREKFKESSHRSTHCAHRDGRKDARKVYAEAIEEAVRRAKWAARREALRRALAPWPAAIWKWPSGAVYPTGEQRFSGKPPAPCPPHALPPRPRHTTSHSHSTGF